MARREACVVGVDGLPLGTRAVVVVGGAVVADLELTSDRGRPLDLEQRVEQAIRLGGERARRRVTEVRLALVDDGSTGTRLQALTARLAAADIAMRVVDLAGAGAGATTTSAIGVDALDPSARRARIAAFGGDGSAGS